MLASFEMTTDHLYDAAAHCKKDEILESLSVLSPETWFLLAQALSSFAWISLWHNLTCQTLTQSQKLIQSHSFKTTWLRLANSLNLASFCLIRFERILTSYFILINLIIKFN